MDYRPCKTDFNLGKHLISFLQDSPFFAELSRHITKIPSRSIKTAGVVYDQKRDTVALLWNPDLFSKLSEREIRGLLTHEYYHLVFGHLYGRRRTPHQAWNIATDAAIDSIIVEADKKSPSRLNGTNILPTWAIIPGVLATKFDGSVMTPEEAAKAEVAQLVASWPPMMASEWYFEDLMRKFPPQECPVHGKDGKSKGSPGGSSSAGGKDKDKGDEPGEDSGGGGNDEDDAQADGDGHGGGGHDHDPNGQDECTCGGTHDEHGGWDGVPEEMREYVEGKIRNMVEKATKHADSQANGWGNIPAELVSEIRASVARVIDWRAVLRQFVGQLVRGNRTTSMKRINKRYPYIHPGVKRGYEAKLIVAIDQSGSVCNEMLVEFFAELGSLTKKVSIDVLPFDCEANEKDIYSWRRGQVIEPKRVRCGGTDFSAPTAIVNDPKNRGRWDGLLIMTDGEAPAPIGSRTRRGWVLGRGCNLMFGTSELTMSLDNSKPLRGAWR